MRPALYWFKLLLLLTATVFVVFAHAHAHATLDAAETEAVVEDELVEAVISDIAEGDVLTEDPDLDVIAPRATAPVGDDEWDEQHPLTPSRQAFRPPASARPLAVGIDLPAPPPRALLRPPPQSA